MSTTVLSQSSPPPSSSSSSPWENSSTTNYTDANTARSAGVADWFAFALVCLVSACFVCVAIYMVRMRHTRWGRPINFQNVPYVIGLMAASIIHMFSVLIANDHFALMNFSCVVWVLWGQYVVGLGMRLVFLTAREFNYVLIYHPRFSQRSPLRRHLVLTLVCVFTISPPVVLAVLASLPEFDLTRQWIDNHVLWRDDVTQWCVMSFPARITVSAWLVLGFLVNLAATVVVSIQQRTKSSDSLTSNDVKQVLAPLRVTVVASILLVCCDLSLTATGSTRFWWGRLLYVFLIIALHVFTIAYLVGVQIWKCYRRDLRYHGQFCVAMTPPTRRLVTFADLRRDANMLDRFMYWCVSEAGRLKINWQYFDKARNVSMNIEPHNAYACWKRLVHRRDGLQMSEAEAPPRRADMAHDIVSEHVGPTCRRPVVVPDWIALNIVHDTEYWRANLFDELEAYLLHVFEQKFWSDYASDTSPDVIDDLNRALNRVQQEAKESDAESVFYMIGDASAGDGESCGDDNYYERSDDSDGHLFGVSLEDGTMLDTYDREVIDGHPSVFTPSTSGIAVIPDAYGRRAKAQVLYNGGELNAGSHFDTLTEVFTAGKKRSSEREKQLAAVAAEFKPYVPVNGPATNLDTFLSGLNQGRPRARDDAGLDSTSDEQDLSDTSSNADSEFSDAPSDTENGDSALREEMFDVN